MKNRRIAPRNRRFRDSVPSAGLEYRVLSGHGRRPPTLSARRLIRKSGPARLREFSRNNTALSDLRSHLKQLLFYLERRGIVKDAKRCQVDVFLISNFELRVIKKRFLGKAAKIVDVLAFPEPAGFPHPEGRKVSLGEIYINRRLAETEPRRGRFLLRHGLLHLLGYRHDRRRDIIKMQNLEKKLEKYYDSRFTAHNRLGHRNRVN